MSFVSLWDKSSDVYKGRPYVPNGPNEIKAIRFMFKGLEWIKMVQPINQKSLNFVISAQPLEKSVLAAQKRSKEAWASSIRFITHLFSFLAHFFHAFKLNSYTSLYAEVPN